MQWDFWSLLPRVGAPGHATSWATAASRASWRHMHGFGSHTYQWINADGERFWVKYHFRSNQGIDELDAARRPTRIAGAGRRLLPPRPVRGDRGAATSRRGTLHVQVMPYDDAADVPLQPVRPDEGVAARRLPADRGRHAHAQPQPGELLRRRSSRPRSRRRTSSRASTSARTRCSWPASSPTPTPSATASAPTTTRCPVERPARGSGAHVLAGRRRAARLQRRRRPPVYAPNSFGGPRRRPRRAPAPGRLGDRRRARTRAAATLHAEDDDFGQAGTLYRDVFDDAARRRASSTTLTGQRSARVTIARDPRALLLVLDASVDAGPRRRSCAPRWPVGAGRDGEPATARVPVA